MKTNKTFNQLFQEYCYTGFLSANDYAKYNLIQRYWDKASPRLKKEADELLSKGKALFDNRMKHEVSRENLLKHISKDDNWKSCYIPIPFEKV